MGAHPSSCGAFIPARTSAAGQFLARSSLCGQKIHGYGADKL